MTTIHLHKTTTATPEQVLAGLTDFGPGREEIFGRSADSYLKVHQQGPHDADVTEGSSGIWERLHYDWTDPHRVVMTTTDSNLWGGASSHTYTLTRQPTGLTDVDASWSGTARTSRESSWRRYSDSSAPKCWESRSRSPSMPSKLATVARAAATHSDKNLTDLSERFEGFRHLLHRLRCHFGFESRLQERRRNLGGTVELDVRVIFDLGRVRTH